MPVRLRWWTTFAAACLACGAWALATPLLAGPDEGQHAVRAAAEVRGTVGDIDWPAFGPVAHVRVPEAFGSALEMACGTLRPDHSPSCAPRFEGGHDLVDATTYEFRPPPAYYWAVGPLTLPWPAAAGVYAMRLATAAACAALLASALASASTARNPKLAGVGVLVASTPMALYLAGQVNPNGVEAAAAICLWSTGQALARPEVEPDRRLVVRAAVALVALALMRGFSAPVAVLAVVATAFTAPAPRRRALARRTDVRVAAAVGAAAALASAAWTYVISRDWRVPRTGRGLDDAPGRTVDFLREAVGVFGGLDLPAPSGTFVLWGLVTAAVLAAGVAGSGVRQRAVALALAAVAVAVPVAVDSFDAPSIGFDWQGRYSLALYAGVVVVATAGAAPRRRLDRWWWVAAAALGVAHVVAFVGTARRLAGGSLRSPGWEPTVPLSTLTIIAVFVAAVAALVVPAGSGAASGPPPRRR